jgi:hypothetical protein
LITDQDTAREMLATLRSEDAVASSGDRRV